MKSYFDFHDFRYTETTRCTQRLHLCKLSGEEKGYMLDHVSAIS
jgi:hypothetical protein